ncbi:MAG: DHHA1 domain-containing protein [Candidatus Pacebacteria bacterium]|nr:DHHA1 domain-containing protein [Candidatus Paceibacterota bacterium]MDD5621015.1 DHHA1 domain-containing protein [Candidatus Paceibacterota bacterium]
MDEILGAKKLAQKIIQTAQKKEPVVIFADADLDGISAAVILKETLEILNPGYKKKGIKIYFPNREKDGYGITISALEILKKYAPAQFFALDCGISNIKEVEIAKKLGFSVSIIDHHQILDGKLPKADVVVDLLQKNETYPFKSFCTAGLMYRLMKPILDSSLLKWEPERFLELVALATIADMMPLEDENKIMVDQGLNALKYTKRTGLKALKDVTKLIDDDSTEVSQKIIAPLNSAEKSGHLTETYILLTSESRREAIVLSRALIKQNLEKKKRVQEIVGEVEERIADKNNIIVFEGDRNWPTIMIGVVASKICNRYKKPVFLFKIGKDESVGSVRPPRGCDGVKAMASCKSLFLGYGGHALACGCRIKNSNMEKARVALEKYFIKNPCQKDE